MRGNYNKIIKLKYISKLIINNIYNKLNKNLQTNKQTNKQTNEIPINCNTFRQCSSNKLPINL